jgi:hypothetical protein
MADENKLSAQLEVVIGLLESLIVLEALKGNISGSSIRDFLGVDMNRVTKISKMVKAARKRQSN